MNQRTYCIDGVTLCDSKQEAEVADFLYLNGIEFEAHKKLPSPSRQKCDFYLPKFQVWLEWDGCREVRALSSNNADVRQERKYEFYRRHDMNYLVLKRDNDWKSLLYETILMS